VADAAPAQARGTAFGVFHLMSGLAMLLASLLAGVLWEQIGASATFVAGALFSGAALVALLLAIARSRSRS
jgi:predicted MFS family arabinose efflux permease